MTKRTQTKLKTTFKAGGDEIGCIYDHDEPGIQIYLMMDNHITPKQARRFAEWLMRAADHVEKAKAKK